MNEMEPIGKPTILIVDDEPQLLISFSLLLEDKFNVLTTVNGREALSIIKDVPVSLLIVDLIMPEMTGVELIECLRFTGCNIPVIVLTGNPDYSVNPLGQGAQVCVIQKPVAVDLLIARIREVLGAC